MSWFWVVLITLGSVVASIALCFYLLHHAADGRGAHFWSEHIACPIFRILALLIIISQIYPVIGSDEFGQGMSSVKFWGFLFQLNHINHLINILFFGGLALAFIPVLSHPVFALPIQSCLTVALVFNWQFANLLGDSVLFLPDFGDILKIVVYMTIAYFVTRELSVWISHWLDRQLTIEGSIHLIADAIYLVLQIPVISTYCIFLKNQLPESPI